MKILLLADHNSTHVIKWATALTEKGIDVCIFSLSAPETDAYEGNKDIQLVTVGFSADTFTSGSLISKLRYVRVLSRLRKLIRAYRPDIVHAHYATSYGLLGVLSGFHPLVISVWGSDVFDFPEKSWLHRRMLKYNLRKADKILSTSHVMAQRTALYVNKEIEVTPFGIDLDVFRPQEVKRLFDENTIVVGTVKTLEEKYGIRYLIAAFARVKVQHPELPMKLLIVGGGTQEKALKKMTADLGIEDDVVFTGRVEHREIVGYYNMLDIYLALSTLDSESFGVAIIEASSCEKPVIVSDVGGLPEVVEDGVTGIVVPPKDVESTVRALEKLVTEEVYRKQMGINGRKRVRELYNWQDNVQQMMDIYQALFKTK